MYPSPSFSRVDHCPHRRNQKGFSQSWQGPFLGLSFPLWKESEKKLIPWHTRWGHAWISRTSLVTVPGHLLAKLWSGLQGLVLPLPLAQSSPLSASTLCWIFLALASPYSPIVLVHIFPSHMAESSQSGHLLAFLRQDASLPSAFCGTHMR